MPRLLQDQLIERERCVLSLHRKACRGLKRGAIHELRVSLRRLVAELELLQPLEAPVDIAKTRRKLKKLLHALRELRDLQVQSKEIGQKKPTALPAPLSGKRARAFLRQLCRERKKAEKDAQKALQSFPASRIEADTLALARYLDRSDTYHPGFERELRLLALRHVRDRFEQVLGAIHSLPGEAPPALAIHRVRICFKHFRYAWELLEPLLAHSEAARSNYERSLKSFQTLLGDIQDLHVLLSSVAELDETGPQGRPGMTPFARELARQQASKIARFMKTYEQGLAPFRAGFRRYPFVRGEHPTPRRRSGPRANSRNSRGKRRPPAQRREA